MLGIWRGVLSSGDCSTAALLADRLLDLAQREGSPASFASAYHAEQSTHLFHGDLIGAEEHFARLSGFLDAAGYRQVPGAAIAAIGGESVWAAASGRADSARERIVQAIVFARDSKNPYNLAFGRGFESWLSCLLREPQRAEVAATYALAIAEENGFPYVKNMILPFLGWARAQFGRADEGVALICQGLAGGAEAGNRLAITYYLTLLTEAQAHDGVIDDALITIEETLAANPKELVFRPNALNCRGELRLKQGDADLAEADFREAIALAQKMPAKAFRATRYNDVARATAPRHRPPR